MNTDQLRYFVTVARMSHMSNAAETLNISEPALIANIRKLEHEVGVDLFDRVGRNIELNDYGKYFQVVAENMLSELSSGVRHIQGMKRHEDCRLVVRTPSLSYFGELRDELHRMFPELRYNNIDCRVNEMVPKLLAGDYDFCIIKKELPDAALDQKVLGTFKMAMIVSEDCDIDRTGSGLLSDFADCDFADFPSGMCSGASELGRACKEAGFTPVVAYASSRLDDLVYSVGTLNYVAWIPAHTIAKIDLKGIRVVNIEGPGSHSKLIMYWNSRVLERRPMASAVRDVFEQYFSSHDYA